ncbi:MAG: hypothetical protein HC905_09945 [Bacteroidales bacterium]|nr:hypothetical protein [Bacteroidales bacterium]
MNPRLDSVSLDTTGYSVTLHYDQAMADAYEQSVFFRITSNNTPLDIKLCRSTLNKVIINFSTAVNSGENIVLNYSGGTLNSLEGKPASDIVNLSVKNNLRE